VAYAPQEEGTIHPSHPRRDGYRLGRAPYCLRTVIANGQPSTDSGSAGTALLQLRTSGVWTTEPSGNEFPQVSTSHTAATRVVSPHQREAVVIHGEAT